MGVREFDLELLGAGAGAYLCFEGSIRYLVREGRWLQGKVGERI